LPEISHYKSLDLCLAEFKDAKIVIADEVADKESVLSIAEEVKRVLVVIGPEGGFSNKERELWNKYPVQRISLGIHRLRAETAAITACALIKDKLRA
jgi:16S rRNA (uracil1498-N3)-methyltransferase